MPQPPPGQDHRQASPYPAKIWFLKLPLAVVRGEERGRQGEEPKAHRTSEMSSFLGNLHFSPSNVQLGLAAAQPKKTVWFLSYIRPTVTL
jgi:hypothetical protein